MSWSAEVPGNPSVAAGTPGRKPVRLKLDTPRDLQKALARLIRMALGGSIETADLGRYANAIATLHKIITDTELEQLGERLERLEGTALPQQRGHR